MANPFKGDKGVVIQVYPDQKAVVNFLSDEHPGELMGDDEFDVNTFPFDFSDMVLLERPWRHWHF